MEVSSSCQLSVVSCRLSVVGCQLGVRPPWSRVHQAKEGGQGGESHVAALHAMHCVIDGSITLPEGSSGHEEGRAGKNHAAALHSMHCVTDGTSDQLSVVSCGFAVKGAIAMGADSPSEGGGRRGKIMRPHCTSCIALSTVRSPRWTLQSLNNGAAERDMPEQSDPASALMDCENRTPSLTEMA